MKTYNDIYLSTRNALRAHGVESYNLEARLLVATAAGKTVPLGGETPLQRDENGHVDPATIADPNDFQDWDDMGCRG